MAQNSQNTTAQNILQTDINRLAEQFTEADFIWTTLPQDWFEAPFLGNGLLGVMLFQGTENSLTLQINRADVYDQRDPEKSWNGVNRPCLPVGAFTVSLNSPIISGRCRLSLFNATLAISLTTEKEEVSAELFIPPIPNVVVFDISAENEDVLCQLCFEPGPALPGVFHKMSNPESYQRNPKPEFEHVDGLERCTQKLLTGGGFCTQWTPFAQVKQQTLFFAVGYSQDVTSAQTEAAQYIEEGKRISLSGLKKDHDVWWQTFFSASSFSIPDKELEIFCLRQIYKFGCATRPEGPVINVSGPWLQPTTWAGIWWNMNVQLAYWIANPSNHPEFNEPLIHLFEKYEHNLRLNVPVQYQQDSLGLGRGSSLDLRSNVGNELHILPWAMHNCYLQYLYTMDKSLLKRIYPLLKQTIQLILHHVEKESLSDSRYVYHLKPAMQGEEKDLVQDSIQLLTLLYWGLSALIHSAEQLEVDKEERSKWEDVLTHLAPLPSDSEIGLIKPTSNYHPADHMCAIYPIHLLSVKRPKDKELIDTTIDYWLKKTKPLPMRDKEGGGYRLTHGAACLAAAGRGKEACELLCTFIKVRMTPNTMYREGNNPTLETPLAGAAALYEMLLQSWNGTLRIFPAIPEEWEDCSFRMLRAEGAFLVSADRENGQTRQVAIQSLKGGIIRLICDISDSQIIESSKAEIVQHDEDSLLISFAEDGYIVIGKEQ